MITSGSSFQICDQAEQPFRYFLVTECLDQTIEQDLLAWFEGGAPWKLVETDFYEQYEFCLFGSNLPSSLTSLISAESLAKLRETVELLLKCRLSDKINLVAHKIVQGQHIAIHNDYLSGKETHRLIVQVNRGLTDEDGGFFMLFNSFNATDVHRVLRPVSGSAIGFEISPTSHHAVSRLHGGERYTLVYSFYVICPENAC